tara:strand:- start:474 stop:1244 length:771 start_codon:yes stop_codon:yes gene_type:complete
MPTILQSAFPEPVSGSMLAVLTLVCIVAGMVRGFSGFGSAMIMAPIYSAVFGPAVAVPVVLLTEMLISLPLLASARKSAVMSTVKQMLLAATAGAVFGLGLVVMLPVDTLASLVALTVLGFVALMIAQDHRQPVRRPATIKQRYLAGGASGLFGSISGMTGPPAVMLLLRTEMPAYAIRATLIVYFMLIDAVLVSLYVVQQEQVRMEWLSLGILSFLPMILGAWLGGKMFNLASEGMFRKITLMLIAGSALGSLFL